ncbi:MAG TPA: serine hydrolase domain-containing protein, partial [Cellvibrionaceae bacterium]
MLKKILWVLFVGLLCLLMVAGLYIFSITAERPVDDARVDSIVSGNEYEAQGQAANVWLSSLYVAHKVPSLSAAVGIGGKVVWAGAIGHADLDGKIAADPSTQYRVGSIAKSLTAAAFMRIQEKSVIQLNDKFRKHVPDYAGGNTDYTLKQLLSHQSGIRHYQSGITENFSNREYTSTREAAAIVEQDPPLFSAGEGFNYSTYGYTLLALAMESAHQYPFEKIMTEEVFSPLQMNSTSFDKADNRHNQNRATPYLLLKNTLLKSPAVNLSYKYAGGGYLSTPTDIVSFANALLGNQFLSEKSVSELWTPVPLNNGDANPENYALGFRLGEDALGRFI